MNRAPNWSRRLRIFGVALTVLGVGTLLAMGIGADGSRSSSATDASFQDYWTAITVWSYIILTPICASLALLFATEPRHWAVINYGVLLLWALFIAWTSTLTL